MSTISSFIGHEHNEPDTWICTCGNKESTGGFGPCDAEGVDMEPDAGWPDLYRCNNCNIIIRHPSREIVGKAAQEVLHMPAK